MLLLSEMVYCMGRKPLGESLGMYLSLMGKYKCGLGMVRRPPNCWGIGRWGHMEDFLPIPWFPIHPYSRGGEAEAGSGWGGQDSAPVTQTRGSQNGLHISG